MSRGRESLSHVVRRRPQQIGPAALQDREKLLRRRALRAIANHQHYNSPHNIWGETTIRHGLDWHTLIAFTTGFNGHQLGQPRWEGAEAEEYVSLVAERLPGEQRPHRYGAPDRAELWLRLWPLLLSRAERYQFALAPRELLAIVEEIAAGRAKCIATYDNDDLRHVVLEQVYSIAKYETGELERKQQEFDLYALRAAALGNIYESIAWLMTSERMAGREAAAAFVDEVWQSCPEELR